MGRWDVGFATYEWRRILDEPAQDPELPQPGQEIWVRKFDEEKWRTETLLRWKSYPVTASRSGKNEIVWHEWSLTDPNEPIRPAQDPELPQPKPEIWVRKFSFNKDELTWHDWPLTDPAQEPYIKPGQIIWVRDTDEQKWRKRRFVRGIHKVVCTAVENDEYDVTWEQWSLTDPNEPPEPQYRPFANAEEFWPFRNCWWRIKGSGDLHSPGFFNERRYGGSPWEICFEKMELLENIDGKMVARPFGLLIEPD
jgi:hypothetical protein